MQTFLPYPEFDKSAAVLDRQRLGKQRVEAYQIIRSITLGNGWAHHPIVKMWTGFENALKLYSNAMVAEWVGRGYRNNMETYNLNGCKIALPWWLGKHEFHAAHRAALWLRITSITQSTVGRRAKNQLCMVCKKKA